MRLLTATLIVLLALAAPAAADNDPRSVVGGGFVHAAPILKPGRYRDSLLPSEFLYYAFELKPGQRLRVTANADMDLERFRSSGLIEIDAGFHSPTRTRVDPFGDFDNNGSFRVVGEPDMDITGPTPTTETDAKLKGPWPGPRRLLPLVLRHLRGPDRAAAAL